MKTRAIFPFSFFFWKKKMKTITWVDNWVKAHKNIIKFVRLFYDGSEKKTAKRI